MALPLAKIGDQSVEKGKEKLTTKHPDLPRLPLHRIRRSTNHRTARLGR